MQDASAEVTKISFYSSGQYLTGTNKQTKSTLKKSQYLHNNAFDGEGEAEEY